MSCAADVDDIDVIHCEAADGRIMRLDWIELVIRRSSLRWVLYLWRTILCHFVRCVFSERSLDLILCTCNASYWTVWRFSAAIFVAHHMPFIPYSPHMPTYLTYIVKTCKKKTRLQAAYISTRLHAYISRSLDPRILYLYVPAFLCAYSIIHKSSQIIACMPSVHPSILGYAHSWVHPSIRSLYWFVIYCAHIFESLSDEYRPHPNYMEIVQVRDDCSKLRSMVVGDAGWRTRAYLAQPKPIGVNLGQPWR